MEGPLFNLGNPEDQHNKQKIFNELFERTLQRKGEGVATIEYNLSYPKEDFLGFIVAQRNVLLHGSSSRDIEIMEPRQANDRKKASGNKKAVYCVTDPVLPIFYAVRDMSKIHGVIESGLGEDPTTGKLKYKFKMPKSSLDVKPWTRGAVYIFDRSQFHSEVNDTGKPSDEWTSEISVRPIAKLEVGPEDFRFLNKIEEV